MRSVGVVEDCARLATPVSTGHIALRPTPLRPRRMDRRGNTPKRVA